MKNIKLMTLSLVVLSSFTLSAQASSEREFRFSQAERNDRIASRQVAQAKEEQKSPPVQLPLTQEKSSCDSKPCGECC
jgi:hypothetical protein